METHVEPTANKKKCEGRIDGKVKEGNEQLVAMGKGNQDSGKKRRT